MATAITNIQSRVRWEARDSDFSLIDTTGLSIANMAYRRLAAIVEWPEFNQSITVAATADTEAITWPTTPVFSDVTSVEMQDGDDNDAYKVVYPVRSELEWSITRKETASFPKVYKRFNDGTNDQILLAPAPKAAQLVRITGKVEPTAFSTSLSATEFISSTADDVLAYVIASDIMYKRNQPNRAQMLMQKVAQILSSMTGKEVVPSELTEEVSG